MTDKPPETVSRFFAAMQAGAAAEADMSKLFAVDAVYVEPFTGKPVEHRGRDAIMAAMRAGWAHPLPDMTIELDRVDVGPGSVTVEWTCRSPALPGGAGRGTNRFTLADGAIARLETSFR
jgi:ketosteroid isomerase-like protein